MKNKYIIECEYNIKLNKREFFIRELIPITDFDHFVRDIEYPEIELLGADSWDGIDLHYGALLESIKINKEQEETIRDLKLIKGYYDSAEEAEKDLEKLNNFIKEHENIWRF